MEHVEFNKFEYYPQIGILAGNGEDYLYDLEGKKKSDFSFKFKKDRLNYFLSI
ncbi:MAG: hypothetical protein NC356_04145 [Ruminococcus sp.]|nr:hypothetical protein [Ruminococcus sp.]